MPVRRIKKGEPGYGRKKFVATGTHQGTLVILTWTSSVTIQSAGATSERATTAMNQDRQTKRGIGHARCGAKPLSASW
jgi:hypothetical protein